MPNIQTWLKKTENILEGYQNEITEFKGGPHEQIQYDFHSAAEAQNSQGKQ